MIEIAPDEQSRRFKVNIAHEYDNMIAARNASNDPIAEIHEGIMNEYLEHFFTFLKDNHLFIPEIEAA